MNAQDSGAFAPTQASRAAAAGLAARLFDTLARHTPDPAGGILRASYGEGEQFAHDLVARTASGMGLIVAHDAARNTYLTLRGSDPDAPAILMGSHMDSVARGGNFDGAAGVVAGLACLAMLQDAGITPRGDLTVMAVRAEESAWFQTSYIGSRAALGQLSAEALAARRVDTGLTLAEHIGQAGGDAEALRRGEAYLSPARIRAFLELHIEQAPSLVHAGLPLAIGTAIPGNFRYPRVQVCGETAHVGLPRIFRRDALVAATRFVAGMDELWERWHEAGRQMAFTVGQFHTDAADDAMTKVAGTAAFSLDVRAYDEADVAALHESVLQLCDEVSQRCGVRIELGTRTTAAVAKADPALRAAFSRIATQLDLPHCDLPSPASHDAAVFGAAGVPMALLLVRNHHGSHNPDEAMALDDFMAGVDVMVRWLADQAA